MLFRSGRKNWLFCWTEVGARSVGIVQSLIASCRLQGVDPYVYFVDVLQRIDTHPAFDVGRRPGEIPAPLFARPLADRAVLVEGQDLFAQRCGSDTARPRSRSEPSTGHDYSR